MPFEEPTGPGGVIGAKRGIMVVDIREGEPATEEHQKKWN